MTRHCACTRIAVVSGHESVAHNLPALSWMVPAEVAMFGLDEPDREGLGGLNDAGAPAMRIGA